MSVSVAQEETANKQAKLVTVSEQLNLTKRSPMRFYRAMHVVLARYCYRKSSVRPSVCDVDVSWAYRLDYVNYTNN